jgi:hypothetical protein
MGYMNEKLWQLFVRKVDEEEIDVPDELKIGDEYRTAVKNICKYGIDRAKTIRDTFPMYTLHDETHICNVMRIMMYLLGDDADKLTRDEAAMLVMSACCHDIGMSYSEKEKAELLEDTDRLKQYLNRNTSEYVKAYSLDKDTPDMTNDMKQNYFRSIHHERVEELLLNIEWSDVLEGNVDRDDLIKVCQSHGKDISSLDEMDKTNTVDLRFCAILLRLADILDFDKSRAPQAIYEYNDFKNANSASKKYSKLEWDKHLTSGGFDFKHIKRTYMYELNYNATCKSMQIEQAVNDYIDWVDLELDNCGKQLRRFDGKWKDFILPGKVKRNIKSEGYESGQYKLTLNQDKIMELFIGEYLYGDPSVFVRELLQNAIDAVRTREQLDRNLPPNWKGQINIRTWMDEEGYHWFRIEDNGIGMTEDIIMNYFLKVGNSYYSSDTFKKEKLECGANPDYTPISRFGIGILSCFMGDKQTNQVEVSTKHFNEGSIHYPALRLSMRGTNGYYYLANSDKHHKPELMKGVTEDEKKQYLTQPGTVIAVRTNLYQTMKYRGFKEIIDKYVVYPPVAIHYDGDDGSCDYITEDEFMTDIHSINPSDNLEERGLLRFSIPDEELEALQRDIPGVKFEKKPELILKCIALDDYTSSPYLKGALIVAKVEGKRIPFKHKLGNMEEDADYMFELLYKRDEDEWLGMRIVVHFGKDNSRLIQRDYNLCRLHEIEWYAKFFKKSKDNIYYHSIVIHNGIMCDSGHNFFDDGQYSYSSYGLADFYVNCNISSIILLKDKYRPIMVGLSRKFLKEISLENAIEMEFISKQIRNNGYNVKSNFGYIHIENSMMDYSELLQKRNDFKKQLLFKTSEGLLSADDLENKLSEGKILIYNSCPHLFNWFSNYILYDKLCITALREGFSIKYKYENYEMVIYITRKETEISQDYKKLFPTNFFLPSTDESGNILTCGYRYRRYACNEYHPLSQFIINNGSKLHERVPGIFNEMLRILAEEDSEEVIKKMNKLLDDLRKLPGGLFNIPDNLYLSEKDFY